MAALAQEVQEIHESSLSKSTRGIYVRYAVRFLRWLLENAPTGLTVDFLASVADVEDPVAVMESLLKGAQPADAFPLSDEFTVQIFEQYLTSIRKIDGSRPNPNTLSSHRSSLQYLMSVHKRPQLAGLDEASLAQYFRGVRRIAAAAKASGAVPAAGPARREGKVPIRFSLYTII